MDARRTERRNRNVHVVCRFATPDFKHFATPQTPFAAIFITASYIFSGAETPSNAKPFLITCATAAINAKRASFTFSSSTKKREAL